MGDPIIAKYGRPKVSHIVSRFYASVLDSPNLSRYFEGVQIRTLVDHQAAFMEAVMGGPQSHTVSELGAVHSNLGIDPEHFDELIRILRDTLQSFEVTADDVEVVVSRYESLRPVIVPSAR